MPTASDVYLETMLRTATPERLRLLVIGAAIRHLRRAREEWTAGRAEDGLESLVRVRDCLTELITSIRPRESDLAAQVQSLYLWMIERTNELAGSLDVAQLDELAAVLGEEQITWAAVCELAKPGPHASPNSSAIASIDPPRTTIPAPMAGAPRRSTMSFEA